MGGGAFALLPTDPIAHSWQLVARLRRRIEHDTNPGVGLSSETHSSSQRLTPLLRDALPRTGGRVGAAESVVQPPPRSAPRGSVGGASAPKGGYSSPTLLMATLAAAPVTPPRGTPRHPHTLATTALAAPVLAPVCYASE